MLARIMVACNHAPGSRGGVRLASQSEKVIIAAGHVGENLKNTIMIFLVACPCRVVGIQNCPRYANKCTRNTFQTEVRSHFGNVALPSIY